MNIQTLGQAVDYIQSLPIEQQKQVFVLIDDFMLSQNHLTETEPTDLQKSFAEWEKYHQKMVNTFDENEMTDEEFDEFWASLRDKNDTGREMVFE